VWQPQRVGRADDRRGRWVSTKRRGESAALPDHRAVEESDEHRGRERAPVAPEDPSDEDVREQPVDQPLDPTCTPALPNNQTSTPAEVDRGQQPQRGDGYRCSIVAQHRQRQSRDQMRDARVQQRRDEDPGSPPIRAHASRSARVPAEVPAATGGDGSERETGGEPEMGVTRAARRAAASAIRT
jgi:hypothetical protein